MHAAVCQDIDLHVSIGVGKHPGSPIDKNVFVNNITINKIQASWAMGCYLKCHK